MSSRRKVDDLGRVVLPKDMRNTLRYAVNQPIEISLEGALIVIRKTTDSCNLCGTEDKLISKGKYTLCESCFQEITEGKK